MPTSTLAGRTDEEILDALTRGGTRTGAAALLGVTEQSVRRAIKSRGLADQTLDKARQLRAEREEFVFDQEQRRRAETPGVWIKGDDATLVGEANPEVLGDVDDLIRQRGLDPADWIVINVVVNTWNAMRGAQHDNDIVDMRQLKITLKRRRFFNLLMPAQDFKPAKRTGKVRRGECEIIVIESDHQVPFHDPRLHEASLKLLEQIEPHEWVSLGDTLDFSTISRHGDHPSTIGITPQVCINQGARLLKDKRESMPGTLMRKLKGNHDWRLESEQLARSERLYDLCPAFEDIPALDLRRLLHFEAMDIELVTDPRGWEHAEIEIVPGPYGLVARHGWMTGHNTAMRSLKRRGRSIVCGHIHKRDHSYIWDPSMECERQGVTIGCMCLVRDERHPHYVTCDEWLQGFAIVSRWADGRFEIEHVRWQDHTLVWRKERITA